MCKTGTCIYGMDKFSTELHSVGHNYLSLSCLLHTIVQWRGVYDSSDSWEPSKHRSGRPHFYQTRSAWSVDQGSNKNHSPAYNFAPTVTKFCVMWEGLSLPQDTKFGNCRCKIVDSRSFPSWSLIHGLRWSGLIKVGPGCRARWHSDICCCLLAPCYHVGTRGGVTKPISSVPLFSWYFIIVQRLVTYRISQSFW